MDINKCYEVVDLYQDPSMFYDKYYKDILIPDELLSKLSKSLGFSIDMYNSMANIDRTLADTLVKSLSKKSGHQEISLIVDIEKKAVVGYSLEAPRVPLLNSDFMKRTLSLSETSSDVSVSEVYYDEDDLISTVLLQKKTPIVIEEKYLNGMTSSVEYTIGVLLVNDEQTTTYSRLVLYVDGCPLYLPASYYNATTTRYKRSTNNSSEALEVLLLKVLEDLRGDSLQSRFYDLHFRYRANKDILASYEEYNSILNTMRKIPTLIEDSSSLSSLLSKYDNFEKKYLHLDDQKSSYIWRCTALGDITISSLLSSTINILKDIGAPSIEYYDIRDLLGSYVSTNRIADEIAKEDLE